MLEKSKSAATALVELLQRKKLTKEQQILVLENRREILVRNNVDIHINETLGQLACMDSGDGLTLRQLYNDKPQVVSIGNKFSLDCRGLYAGVPFYRGKDGVRLTFGLDNLSWLLIKITYSTVDKCEKASLVQVIRTDLSTILEELAIEPIFIWSYFKIVTDEWVSNRKALYDQACKVADGMKEEGIILSLIT